MASLHVRDSMIFRLIFFATIYRLPAGFSAWFGGVISPLKERFAGQVRINQKKLKAPFRTYLSLNGIFFQIAATEFQFAAPHRLD